MLQKLLSKTLFWEALAVALGLGYSLSLVNKYWFSWSFAIFSSVIFFGLCIHKKIYAEAGLHIFYLATAIYGWLQFDSNLEISWDLKWSHHLIFIFGMTLLTVGLGYILNRYTSQATPYLDSFTTIFSMGATVLMIHLIRENWLYFIVINSFAVWLYANRKLYLTAVLMLVYAGVALAGYFNWS